jgi:hypothetical protein
LNSIDSTVHAHIVVTDALDPALLASAVPSELAFIEVTTYARTTAWSTATACSSASRPRSTSRPQPGCRA